MSAGGRGAAHWTHTLPQWKEGDPQTEQSFVPGLLAHYLPSTCSRALCSPAGRLSRTDIPEHLVSSRLLKMPFSSWGKTLSAL